MTQQLDAWWRSAVIYQIYPRSFADSDGDGIGDLPGITARLEHLADLGVDAAWLSPFYVSPMADAGYDVADYRDIDPVFGTLADADALVAEAHRLGLRVIVDLVPNHTSDQHVWFKAALAATPGSPERARYIFREGKGEHGEEPPNHWRSVFGGPAWTRVTGPDGLPGQWYLHLFDVTQPDLDWTNPEVREEFHDVLRFWLHRGVDGFRVDVAHGLVKAEGLPDWDYDHGLLDSTEKLGRPPMWDQDGVHEIYRAWRKVLDEYDDRVLVAEAWVEPPERLAKYVRHDEMHQAFNFEYLTTRWVAADLREVITSSISATAAVGAPTTWVLSNHDVVRHTTRLALPLSGPKRPNGIKATDPQPDQVLGLRRGRAATAVMLALPGSAYVYQGEELGLPEHTTMPDDARQDPTFFRTGGTVAGRDGCRVPIPWERNAPAYGFSPSGRSWLPQPESFAGHAADQERGVPGSTLELYREMLRLRRELGLGLGELEWVDDLGGDDVVAFRRGEVLVVANLGGEPVPLPSGTRVLLTSGPLDEQDRVPTDTTVWLTPAS
ncbi:glycoside hydrolase family 13 protein [Pseudonocardia sp. TRM90224]|uniref:glycoside hydrolase family 13 protein n=1 Tax=Pseudonocardia sp. TRM90224 TaxID=2812678 RepID=UPI001E605EF5|nr:alpha-amylase family glycosyl hydrolase [Pseudonocardia sp. TRM90224]